MRQIRTFVAIEMPEGIVRQFEDVEARLMKADAHVKWVEPYNIHITMKFLGEIDEGRLGGLYEGVMGGTRGFNPFEVSLAGLGAFPNLRRPRVVWIGIDMGKENLTELQNRLEESIYIHGFSKEDRSFSPHLTIGRVKSPRGLEELAEIIKATSFQTASFPVNEVVVMESTLTPEGPIYSPLRKIGL
jgi:RNA 2',3'-cyclic 3'-phosphodiesterase